MFLDERIVQADVERALAEDIGTGDVTASLLPPDLKITAQILTREPLLVCGRPWVDAVFKALDSNITINWRVEEGQWLEQAGVLCHLSGYARALLTAERAALNFLQTFSATATQTYHYLQALKPLPTRLLDTRKTLPGLRIGQKYAVACAGGSNHRLGLFDAFLIKENHIKACGSIKQAVERARERAGHLAVEVEVETIEEFNEALAAKPDRILLDNFSLSQLQQVVDLNKPKQCELEASGGINLNTIRAVAETGVDFISVGQLTKSIQAIDLSLLVETC